MIKVNWINIQGFRSFGKELQNIKLNPKISVIWGANSQGKTSFSEAIEFLLTGQISRKILLSSTQDEFADSLKNAFISDKTDIYVEAEFQNSESRIFKVKRTLIQDYGKKNDCSSTLEINDLLATENDLVKLGVPLFQQPMPASILMQHALSYLFSARPQDRSSYFKALLEVTDLDEFRNSVLEAFKSICVTPRWRYIDKLESILRIDPFSSHLKINSESKQTKESIRSSFIRMLDQLIEESKFNASFEQKIEHLKDQLISIQKKVFPIHLLGESKVTPFNSMGQGIWDELEIYYDHAKKTTELTKRLAPIFQELLELEYVSEAKSDIDCPVCNIKDSLTLDRINEIKHVIFDSKKYIDSRHNARRRSWIDRPESFKGI
ncbi:MAG: ATP-binding protein [Gammaproteobacteria bacterium]